MVPKATLEQNSECKVNRVMEQNPLKKTELKSEKGADVKMKILLLLIFLIIISFLSISFAQITREQADKIVLQYIIDEEMRTDVLLLETTSMLPNAEGTSTITTHLFGNYETFSIEYPCWVYHIYEWADENCCRPHRYNTSFKI